MARGENRLYPYCHPCEVPGCAPGAPSGPPDLCFTIRSVNGGIPGEFGIRLRDRSDVFRRRRADLELSGTVGKETRVLTVILAIAISLRRG